MTNKSLYELKYISYSYLNRFPALRDVDFHITEGERIALLGANGSGKSTLLLILAGLIFPNQGFIKFMGKDLREDSLNDQVFQRWFRKLVGIVFQNSDIQLFNSNVEDELAFGLSQLDISPEETKTRIEKYLAIMDIAHLRERHPQNLSIGEKKRVAIASTLALEPQIILLDEPTAGLDPRTSRHLIDLVSSLNKNDHTIIVATQDMHIVNEIAERIIVLSEDKRIARDGNAADILTDRDFLEKQNLVHIHAHKHKDTIHVHPHEHPDHHHPHIE